MSRRLTDSERRTWARIARTAKPLPGRSHPIVEGPAPTSAAPAVRVIPPPPHAPLRGSAAPADLSTQRRIRRGQAEIEARIDLHGHTQDSARGVLFDFLARTRGAGMRCVLVITGKGRLGQGVLRARFLDWMAGPDLRDLVSGYAPAHARHGGDGAFYVMLRARPAAR